MQYTTALKNLIGWPEPVFTHRSNFDQGDVDSFDFGARFFRVGHRGLCRAVSVAIDLRSFQSSD